MSNKLSLLVNFVGVDKMSGALKNIISLGRKGSTSLGALRGESRKLESELRKVRKELGSASGNVTELMNRERALERQIEETNQSIEQQKAKLAELGRARGIRELGGKITGVGQSMSLYVTAPLVAAGYASTQMAKDFDASMSNIATLVDTSTESMDLMGKRVLDLSSRVPVALEELPPALYDIRSAGIQASDAMAVLEGSAKLATAGLATTQESAGIVTSAINAFNLKGAEQQRIYDLLFKTVKNGKTTISGLAQGFGGVAGTIANAGVEIDEYLASVAALTTTGLPAAQAHTQLRAVIAGLTRETGKSRAMFQRLGSKDMKDLIAQSGGLVPALNRIKQELGGNDAEMLQLFGSTEALNAVLGLTGNQAEAFTKTLADMRDGANAIDPAFAKQAETDAAKQIENMNKFRTAAIEAGNAILPVMTSVMGVVADVATAFSELSPGTQTFILGALGIAAVAGPVLVAIGGIVSIFGTLVGAAATLGVGVGALAGVIFGIPIAIAVVAGLIWYYWEDISAAFQWGWDKAKSLLSAAPDWLKGIGKAMMTGLLMAINPLALGAKLIGMAKNGITAFKNYLGIKSPSRVFMALGQHTTEGLAMGIDRGGKRPVGAMRGLAAGVAAAGSFSLTPIAASAAGQQNAGVPAFGQQPATTGMTVTINIQQQPGEDAQALAERVRRELERLAGQAARSSYRDDA
jgi:TP901 family phage tail tape measure protein